MASGKKYLESCDIFGYSISAKWTIAYAGDDLCSK